MAKTRLASHLTGHRHEDGKNRAVELDLAETKTSVTQTKTSLRLSDSQHKAALNSAERIIEKFGGQTRLAKLIGRRQSTVQHWPKIGFIPARWHQKIFDVAAEHGVSLSPAEFVAVVTRE